MMNTTWKIALGIVALVAVVACFLPFGGTSIVERTVGANPGPDSYARAFFHESLTDGGKVVATSSATATYTPTDKDWQMGKIFEWQATGALTLAIGATSTYAYVPNIGDTASILIHNASTTAAAGSSITFSAVNGLVDLQKNEDVADLACAVYDYCKLTFIRKSATEVTVIYDNYVIAD